MPAFCWQRTNLSMTSLPGRAFNTGVSCKSGSYCTNYTSFNFVQSVNLFKIWGFNQTQSWQTNDQDQSHWLVGDFHLDLMSIFFVKFKFQDEMFVTSYSQSIQTIRVFQNSFQQANWPSLPNLPLVGKFW